jgi:hypothetical protein
VSDRVARRLSLLVLVCYYYFHLHLHYNAAALRFPSVLPARSGADYGNMADPTTAITTTHSHSPPGPNVTRPTALAPQPPTNHTITATTPPSPSTACFPTKSPKSPRPTTATSPSYSRPKFSTVPSTSPKSSRQTTRISPGLQLRLRLLDEQTRRLLEKHWNHEDIGRIPEEQLAELEERLKEHSKDSSAGAAHRAAAAAKAWLGPSVRIMPSGGVLLSGGPVPSEIELSSSALESDVCSSPISLGTRLVPSDSEEDGEEEKKEEEEEEGEDALRDGRKYRMPEVGKTRLHLRTKEPLSPTPRQIRTESRRESAQSGAARTESRRESMQSGHTRTESRRESTISGPVTPRENRSAMGMRQSPEMSFSPRSNGYRNGSSENVSDSDWIGSGLSRAGSIYSLGRASFTGQLSQLTAMKLPDADSLARRISSIPTSTEAAKALSDATEQIMLWIGKASEALSGLNAEDDVDWAAAGGREGIEEVDGAINRFEKLVQVYIVAIEKLQTRDDIDLLSADDLNNSVKQLEGVIMAWHKIKQTMKGIREQVEVAMEWEELWSSVLGEIASEMEALNRLVFEMEEKRHEGAESLLTVKEGLDLNELETIVEDRPGRGKKASNRFSVLPPFSSSSPLQPVDHTESKEDASLLALFARMQPLRASLDFLPMRLSTFHIRGNVVFPTACEDLEKRRSQLEEQWGKLEDDSEALRRELGEDRWVLVFRNAGRQALKMCESISRSFAKLKEGIDTGEHQFNMAGLSKKIENYEAKVQHYGPAIERVLAIIDKGVLDRLTVNGEILRLQSDMKRRWSALQEDVRDMELVLEDISIEAKERQLRDSVSTVMSSERSIGSSFLDTPGSSPASSVVEVSRKSSFQGSRTPTPLNNTKTRKISFTPVTASRSSTRLPSSSTTRRVPLTFKDVRATPSPSSSFALTPPGSTASTLTWSAQTASRPDNRPRWTTISKAKSRDFAPLSKFEPSPYAKAPITPKPYIPRHTTAPSTVPTSGRRSQAGSRIASDPILFQIRPPSAAFSRSETATSRKSSLPVPITPSSSQNHNQNQNRCVTPSTGRSQSSLATKRPLSSLRGPVSASAAYRTRRSSMLPVPPSFRDGNEADSDSALGSLEVRSRPPSAMAAAGASGRRSSVMGSGARSRMEGEERPKWR